jgi:hypothetical protein
VSGRIQLKQTRPAAAIESLCMHLPRHGDSIIVCGTHGPKMAMSLTPSERLSSKITMGTGSSCAMMLPMPLLQRY